MIVIFGIILIVLAFVFGGRPIPWERHPDRDLIRLPGTPWFKRADWRSAYAYWKALESDE